MRILLIFLSLTLAALAQALPQDWLIMPADLRAYMPADYQINKSVQKIQSHNFITVSFAQVLYVDRKRHIVVMSHLSRNQSNLRAEMGYSAHQFSNQFITKDFKSPADYSQQIKAGDTSECKRMTDTFWSFRYRKKRVWGALMIGGLNLTPEQMKAVVHDWVARVDALQVRKKPHSNSGWPFFKK